MSETRIERETRPWEPFGNHSDGTVNISDGVNHQILEHIVPEHAKGICWARKVFLSRVRNILAGKPIDISKTALHTGPNVFSQKD